MIKNKTILITGHTSGLGESLNKLFFKYNNRIIGLSKSKSKIKNYKNIVVNFENLNNLKVKLKKLKFLKNIDYVFLNAGVLGNIENVTKIKISDFQRILNINCFANKIIIDFFIQNKIYVKNFISISSGAAISAKDGWSLYCVSKACLKMLIENYNLEIKKTSFLSLAPGIFETKMQKKIRKSSKKFSSTSKFINLYNKNLILPPNQIAEKIVKFLKNKKNLKKLNYFDLRN